MNGSVSGFIPGQTILLKVFPKSTIIIDKMIDDRILCQYSNIYDCDTPRKAISIYRDFDMKAIQRAMSNRLIDRFPEAFAEWDFERNSRHNINKITYGSQVVVGWICEKGHKYDVDVKTRTRFGRWNGCKLCKSAANSLLARFPEIIKEWDFERNQAFDINTISFSSEKQVNWLCLNDKTHRYIASPHSRTANDIDRRCLICKLQESLLILRYPEVVNQWDFERNTAHDIKTITFASHTVVGWICQLGHRYEQSPQVRTHGGRLNGCIVCYDESKRVHNKEEVDRLISRKIEQNLNTDPSFSRVEIGDESEEYIAQLLRNTRLYKDVDRMGYLAADGDIAIYDLNSVVRYIQVKTLSLRADRKNGFFLNNNTKYPDNMLIVAVDRSRQFFAVEFAGNLKRSSISLKYGTGKSKYEDIMFTASNIVNLIQRIVKLIPFSCSTFRMSDENRKESLMLERLESKCTATGFKCLRNDTNGNTVDGTINGYTFQAKYVSKPSKHSEVYVVTTKKHAGMLNGHRIKMSYQVGDFDFLIVEVGGTKEHPHRYEGHFCIIPSKELEAQRMFVTDSNKGKVAVCVCPPDYKGDHWSKKFWDIAPLEMYNPR